jgi:hypothetical protein
MTKMHRGIIWLIIHHGDFCEHVGSLSENSHVSAHTLVTSIFVTHTRICACMHAHRMVMVMEKIVIKIWLFYYADCRVNSEKPIPYLKRLL